MDLALVILRAPDNGAFHHHASVGGASCNALDSPSNGREQQTFQVFKIFGHAHRSAIVNLNWNGVGMEDCPAHLKVGCNIGFTRHNARQARKLADTDLLAWLVMHVAAFGVIDSCCLLALTSCLDVKTPHNPMSSRGGEMLNKRGCD